MLKKKKDKKEKKMKVFNKTNLFRADRNKCALGTETNVNFKTWYVHLHVGF